MSAGVASVRRDQVVGHLQKVWPRLLVGFAHGWWQLDLPSEPSLWLGSPAGVTTRWALLQRMPTADRRSSC